MTPNSTSPHATGAPHSARAVKVPSCAAWAVASRLDTQVTPARSRDLDARVASASTHVQWRTS